MSALPTRFAGRALPLLALIPLGLAQPAMASRLPGSDDPMWALCGPMAGFGWETPLPAATGAAPVRIDADHVDVSGKDVYRWQGGVRIEQAGRRLEADTLDYTHSSSAYEARGNVHYQDGQLAIQAERASGNLDADRSRLERLDYRLRSARGNGSAAAAEMQGERARLSRLTYTTCNPGHAGWRMDAGRLELDQASGVGYARNATLKVGDLPILWLPYASFPIDDRRRSGFLYPSLGYADDTGIDVRAPYYLDIAPNMDATLTPRLLGRRGVMLGGEFRYLGAEGGGDLEASWLPDDDLSGRDRGRARFRHNGRLGEFWALRANLNHVSDDRYFEDFGDSLTSRATSLVESRAGLFGRGPGWNASLSARAWDLIDPLASDAAEPYRQLPRLAFGLDRGLGDHLRYGLDAEAVVFQHRVEGLESRFQRGSAERYDLQPWLELPVETAAGYLRPRLGWRHTAYQLDHGWARDAGDCAAYGCAGTLLFPDRSPSRSTAIGSLDAALNFERDTRLFGHGMLQTLQPRLYYLRVPYEAQDDIPLFDTQPLTFSFDQLFRSNRFSGADRQGDANQLTLALTSRWFEDHSGRERLSASLGQIRYFDDLRVQLPGAPVEQRSGSAWVGGVDVALSERWSLGYAHQYDPEIDRSTVSGFRTQWQDEVGRLANLSYRYRRGELEQADASFAIPVNESWRWVGRWNYSLRDDSTLEALGGLEWQNCCVAFRILGRHYVRNREGDTNNALYFELELKGLASFGRDTAGFLQRAILGYSR